MKRLAFLTITTASALVVAAPASADIVKAPVGPSSKLKLNASVSKSLKKKHVSLGATGSSRKSGSTLSLPYSLSRWDFGAHEGDVAYFSKATGFRLKRRGGRSVTMVHPRVVVDGPDAYITALIAGVRVKTFTFKIASGTIRNDASQQQISGLRLKLTKASAQMLNKGLRRKVFRSYTQFGTLELNIGRPSATSPSVVSLANAPGQGTNPGGTLRIGPGLLGVLPTGSVLGTLAPGVGVDTDGDGQPDTGVAGLALKGATFDAATDRGTISLSGGLTVKAAGGDVVALSDPEVVVGTNAQSSGVYALVNGVRIKVGDFDPATLNVHTADGTVNITGLNAQVSPGVVLPGVGLLPAGAQLMTLDISLPQS